MKLCKMLSVLVASGRAARCNRVLFELDRAVRVVDPISGRSGLAILKEGAGAGGRDFVRVMSEATRAVWPILNDVPEWFWGTDRRTHDPRRMN